MLVQTWRPGRWSSWTFEVGAQQARFNASNNTNFVFSRGGFQGSRGEKTGDSVYIENVFEELDVGHLNVLRAARAWARPPSALAPPRALAPPACAVRPRTPHGHPPLPHRPQAPGEFFFNTSTQTLFLWHNASSGTAPPSDGSIAVTVNRWLVNISGSQAAPVQNVAVVGLGFRDTRDTQLDNHSMPSSGDWALPRSAVVFIEGTENTTVSGCVFERVDGNSVMLSAYNRGARITHNEFAWTGASAVVVWGNTYAPLYPDVPAGLGYDGSGGDQPRGSLIAWNVMRGECPKPHPDPTLTPRPSTPQTHPNRNPPPPAHPNPNRNRNWRVGQAEQRLRHLPVERAARGREHHLQRPTRAHQRERRLPRRQPRRGERNHELVP
jgi:hypothetical protein